MEIKYGVWLSILCWRLNKSTKQGTAVQNNSRWVSVRAAWVVILDWTGSYCRALSAPQLYTSLFNQHPSIACVCAWWLSSTVAVDVAECRRMTSKDMSVSNVSVQRHLLPVSVKQYKKTSSTDPDAIGGFMSLCCRKLEVQRNVNSSHNSRWYGELEARDKSNFLVKSLL